MIASLEELPKMVPSHTLRQKTRVIHMDRHFYLSFENRIEGQRDKPLVDVICGFLEDCAAQHLAESKGWGRAAEREHHREEKDYFIKDFRRKMSRWQHAVRACLERVVVDVDPGREETGALGRSVAEIENALGWLDSSGDSFADTLISNSVVKLEEPPCP